MKKKDFRKTSSYAIWQDIKSMQPKFEKDRLQIAVIVGQLSNLQPATLNGNKIYILDGKIAESWLKSMKKIIEN